MYTPDAPSLPSAAPLTAVAAARWRAARTAWRLDSRWLALVPLAVTVLATATEPDDSGVCNVQGICHTAGGESLAVWTLLAEILLLLLKPRIRPLIPPVALAVLWYAPQGLVEPLTRWSTVLAHVLLTAVLVGAELGRRRARQQLDELMNPPAPFPWTAVGAPPPMPPDGPPVGRRLLGVLLLAAALAVPLFGLWEQHRWEEAEQRSVRVTGVAAETDQDGLLSVRYQPPGGGDRRTARLDLWWAAVPQPGQYVPLLVDGDSVRAEGETYDLDGDLGLGAMIALPALLLLGSAFVHDARRTRPSFEGAAPALAVRLRADGRGGLLVLPVDGPPGARPLWRLLERDRYYWAHEGVPDDPEPAWIVEHPDLEGDDVDYPDHSDHSEGEEEAAADRARPDRIVPAVLYRGPDGLDPQLLFRPALLPGDPSWLAAVAAPAARAPRLRRALRTRRERDREREDTVAAISARTVADAPAPGAQPLPALRWELPLPVRALAGPLAAVALAALAVLLGGDGLWKGMLRPLWLGTVAVGAFAQACSWQLVADREGLRVATALRVRSYEWRQIGGAAVHKGALTVQLRSGEDLTANIRLMAALAGHLGERYDAVRLARTVAVAANRPDLRPVETLPEGLGRPQNLLNRLALTGYAVFTVAHYLAG
ncbi:hypothetical protein [Streptomyces sp. NRRL WC-3742]|uniref:hypothetical protein n=1 Tax=Streptomyces sp. NRRL WC-3742 TaxID=1463934 RepID=UPI0004C6F18F|nr:hypothetical protein [Streptomyces sp. NRRL WC-3742]